MSEREREEDQFGEIEACSSSSMERVSSSYFFLVTKNPSMSRSRMKQWSGPHLRKKRVYSQKEFEKAGFLGTMRTPSMIEMPRLRKSENEVLRFVKAVETGSYGKAKRRL